jgi:hypothetical protein
MRTLRRWLRSSYVAGVVKPGRVSSGRRSPACGVRASSPRHVRSAGASGSKNRPGSSTTSVCFRLNPSTARSCTRAWRLFSNSISRQARPDHASRLSATGLRAADPGGDRLSGRASAAHARPDGAAAAGQAGADSHVDCTADAAAHGSTGPHRTRPAVYAATTPDAKSRRPRSSFWRCRRVPRRPDDG